jgi:hypothetical protein
MIGDASLRNEEVGGDGRRRGQGKTRAVIEKPTSFKCRTRAVQVCWAQVPAAAYVSLFKGMVNAKIKTTVGCSENEEFGWSE